jgi:hypothetical protein
VTAASTSARRDQLLRRHPRPHADSTSLPAARRVHRLQPAPLRAKGLGEEEIAARFFVSVVKQRLRLASVSPRLFETYGEDEMTLE